MVHQGNPFGSSSGPEQAGNFTLTLVVGFLCEGEIP
jgi:hypothetical protein